MVSKPNEQAVKATDKPEQTEEHITIGNSRMEQADAWDVVKGLLLNAGGHPYEFTIHPTCMRSFYA